MLGRKCLDRVTTEVIGARRTPIPLSLPYYCNTETWPGTPAIQWRHLVTMCTTEVALWYCATLRFLPAKLKIYPGLLILPIFCQGKQGNSDTSSTALSYTHRYKTPPPGDAVKFGHVVEFRYFAFSGWLKNGSQLLWLAERRKTWWNSTVARITHPRCVTVMSIPWQRRCSLAHQSWWIHLNALSPICWRKHFSIDVIFERTCSLFPQL